MQHLEAIGCVHLDDKQILLPCQLVNEDNQLWLHFLDQTHVVMLGFDRVEVVWTRILSKNRVDCGIDGCFGNLPVVRVYTGTLSYESLVRFLENDWLTSNNSKSIFYSESEEVEDSTDDDTTETYETQPMDTSNDSDSNEASTEEPSTDEPAPKRGWFSWVW